MEHFLGISKESTPAVLSHVFVLQLQEAVENGFDDLLGLSDDEDEDLSTDQLVQLLAIN